VHVPTITPTPTMRERLAAGETLVGTFLGLGSPAAAEACGHAGLDWVLVDLEHGPAGDESLLAQLLAARSAGVHGLVRIAAPERIRAGRALDAGAEGVMFPRITSIEDAREAAGALRHSPAGLRGVAGGHRGHGYGLAFDPAASDERTLGIIQIEHPGALAVAKEIAALAAADVLFVGPNDLSYAMGIPGQLEHPDFRAAVETVVSAAEGAGKAAGIMVSGPEGVGPAAADGFRMIAVSSELGLLLRAAQEVAAAARALS
jgi:2-keto-3-deoxy-L-rhamnonate aldolase RhmA